MHRTFVAIVSAAAFLVTSAHLVGQEKKPDGNINGKWKVTAHTFDGKESPAEKLEGVYLEFKGDKAWMHTKAKGKFDYGTIAIDSTKSPKEITFSGARVAKGIYKRDGDALTICLDGDGKEFASTPGSEAILFVGKLVKE
ncbi:MAG TPA: TIGR03067 domain-containing protein [Urbifossiella sp.]|nr:TIGR03067 domain-containing protein [Urbifossiella sp.]